MPTTTITSRRNPLVARFRDVARGEERGQLLLDGAHLIRGAIDAGLSLHEVVVSTEAAHREEVVALVGSLPRGVAVATVSSSVMEAVSPVRTPSGIVALSTAPPASEQRLFARLAPIVIAADIQDPGNLGAIVRVADAAGAAGVIAAGHSANPFGWKALRGSMASALRLPIVIIQDMAAALDLVRRHACRIVATVPAGGTHHVDADLRGPIAIVIGGEGHGLTDDVISIADARVTIPMEAGVESLNAAVAAAILVYEARRQRGD